MSGPANDSLSRRRLSAATLPLQLLAWTSGLLLVAEIVRANVPVERQQHDWPWNVSLLGIPTTAMLFVVSLAVLLVRDQYARSLAPVLRYVSQWVTDTDGLAGPAGRYRQVVLRNAGSGTAVIASTAWRVQAGSDETRDLTSMTDLRRLLDALDLRDGADYTITNVTSGAALAPGEERLYFECTEETLGRFLVFDARLTFDSLVGDRYEKTVSLLPRPGASEVADPPERILA